MATLNSPLNLNASAPASLPTPGPNYEAMALWSRHELGLDDATDAAQKRSLVLDRLQSDRWVPAISTQRAVELLGQPKDSRRATHVHVSDGSLYFAAEKRQAEAVEKFLRQFFELPTEERRKQWNDLRAASAGFPRLAKRLAGVEAGLNVELPGSAVGWPVWDLTQHLGEYFLATPAERVRLKLALLERSAGSMTRWQVGARQIRTDYPKIAALNGDYVNKLSLQMSAPVLDDQDANDGPVSSGIRSDYRVLDSRTDGNRIRQTNGYSVLAKPGFFILLMVVAKLFSAFLSQSNSPSKTPNYRSTPSYQQPNTRGPVELPPDLSKFLNDRSGTKGAEQPGTIPVAPPSLRPPNVNVPQYAPTPNVPSPGNNRSSNFGRPSSSGFSPPGVSPPSPGRPR